MLTAGQKCLERGENPMNKEIEAVIAEKAAEIDRILEQYLPRPEGFQKTVVDAMHYSVTAGGKRLRPMLMQETYRMCGGQGKIVEPFMAALEMIHTYSLVHDDLPAMDNDEYRRGRKTTHVVYGEGMAVLAGDALLNYAFETAATAFSSCEVDGVPVIERYRAAAAAISLLGRKAGIYGMIGGQTADLEAENARTGNMEQLLFIHEHKTAALIEAAMMIGAVLAGADAETVAGLEKCARNIGVAFQIQDDILDVTGDAAQLGKAVGSDEKNHKTTYVTEKGLEQAQKDVERLSGEAIHILQGFGENSGFLQELTRYLIHRQK